MILIFKKIKKVIFDYHPWQNSNNVHKIAPKEIKIIIYNYLSFI